MKSLDGVLHKLVKQVNKVKNSNIPPLTVMSSDNEDIMYIVSDNLRVRITCKINGKGMINFNEPLTNTSINASIEKVHRLLFLDVMRRLFTPLHDYLDK